jgi:sec-independent protein translocase protein TatB
MFGIGGIELIVLAIILLIVIGPKQLPEVMRTIAKFVREILKARDEFKKSIDQDENLSSLRDTYKDVKGAVDSKVSTIRTTLEKEIKDIASENPSAPKKEGDS